jgi:hypothetical protein
MYFGFEGGYLDPYNAIPHYSYYGTNFNSVADAIVGYYGFTKPREGHSISNFSDVVR